jgi:hypothetical protein
MQFLANGVSSCKSVDELERWYQLMVEHVERFVIQPKENNQKLVKNHKITPQHLTSPILLAKY